MDLSEAFALQALEAATHDGDLAADNVGAEAAVCSQLIVAVGRFGYRFSTKNNFTVHVCQRRYGS